MLCNFRVGKWGDRFQARHSDAPADSQLWSRSSPRERYSPMIFGVLMFILDQLIRMPLLIWLYTAPDCRFSTVSWAESRNRCRLPYGVWAKSTTVMILLKTIKYIWGKQRKLRAITHEIQNHSIRFPVEPLHLT